MKEIYALGVGHGTPIFIELAEACGYKVGGLYHYNDARTGESDHGYIILGSFNDLLNSTNIEIGTISATIPSSASETSTYKISIIDQFHWAILSLNISNESRSFN